MRHHHVSGFFLLWMISSGIAACNDAKFSGDAPRSPGAVQPPAPTPQPTPTPVPAPEPGVETLSLTCEEGTRGDEVAEVALKDGKPVKVAVKGQLCPAGAGAATVLFVVDFSGSMGKHTPQGGGSVVSGNDPQTGGSCGRLKAAEALVAKLESGVGAGDDVKVGMVVFAGDTLDGRTVTPVALQTFKTYLTADAFCSYVVQGASYGYHPENPGGIDGRTTDSSTNYAAAFAAAEDVLAREGGGATVYFVSDGEPTSGGYDPVRAGVEAGRRLRQRLPNVTVNGLLLGSDGARARDVLTQVVGDPARVRVAGKADELATEIVKFPGATKLKEGSFRATLGGKELALRGLSETAAGVWEFLTEALELQNEGETRFEARAETEAGQPLAAGLTVRVKRL